MTAISQHGSLDDSLVRDCLATLQTAAQWRLAGLLLAAPRDGWRQDVAALAADVDDDALRDAAQGALREADPGQYDSAFGPGGPAPPREVSYRPASLSSQHLAELAGAYEAFAYASPYDEPIDHVAVVADFVAYLKVKEAFAAARGVLDDARAASDLAAYVIAEHLAYIARPLAERLIASHLSYLSAAAAWVGAQVGAPRGGQPQSLPVLAEADEEECWSCGETSEPCGDEADLW